MPKSRIAPAGSGTADCCPPVSVLPLTQAQADEVAPQLKALADPVRLRLLSLVASYPGGEACVCDLSGAFDLSQPTISHHLKVLYQAGLLGREKRQIWVSYQARAEVLAGIAALISEGCVNCFPAAADPPAGTPVPVPTAPATSARRGDDDSA